MLYICLIKLVGVNIRKDARQLEKALSINVANSLCIEDIGKILSLKNCSLKQLSNDYVGIKLEKGKGKYQWDSCKYNFSHRSAEYAANDAISSLLVFRKMLSLPETELNPENKVFTSEQVQTIANHTQFYVNTSKDHRKGLNNVDIDKKKFLKIIDRIEQVAHSKPVSYAKLVRIIKLTCAAFPENDPQSEEKARDLISFFLERGYLMRK